MAGVARGACATLSRVMSSRPTRRKLTPFTGVHTPGGLGVGGCLGTSAMLISEGMGLSYTPARVCMYHVCALEEIMGTDISGGGLWRKLLLLTTTSDLCAHVRMVCFVFVMCSGSEAGVLAWACLWVPVSGSRISVS